VTVQYNYNSTHSEPVNYSYNSTPISACTVQLYLYSPKYLYSTAIPILPSVTVQYSYTSTLISALQYSYNSTPLSTCRVQL